MPRNQTCHLITGQRYGFFTFRINRQNRINYFFLRFFFFSVINPTYSLQKMHPPASPYRNPFPGACYRRRY